MHELPFIFFVSCRCISQYTTCLPAGLGLPAAIRLLAREPFDEEFNLFDGFSGTGGSRSFGSAAVCFLYFLLGS